MGEYDSKVVSFQQESGFVHQRALMNWRAGNYPDALNLIRKAVESDPTDARCRLDMARILVSMELYEAAGRQLMWLLSEARELEECLFLSGKILYARGRQEEAENALRAYVDHSGGHESVEEAERMLDRIYLNSEIQEQMAEDRRERRVQKLIEEGIRQLGALGDSRSSEQAFGHAVRLNPLRVSAHALYAVVLNLNGKPEDARREAIMAGRLLGPSAPLPDVCICAQALYESGMREEGRELMSRAREMDADDEGKRVRVTALERLEMYDEACEAQGELVAAHPYNPAMLHEMSCLAFLAGKPAETVANGWKRIHRLDPADPAPEMLLQKLAEGSLTPEDCSLRYETCDARLQAFQAFHLGEVPRILKEEGVAQAWRNDKAFRATLEWQLSAAAPSISATAACLLSRIDDDEAHRMACAYIGRPDIPAEVRVAAMLGMDSAILDETPLPEYYMEATLPTETDVLRDLPVGARQMLRDAAEYVEEETGDYPISVLAGYWLMFQKKRLDGGAAIARGDVGAAALAYLYLNADGESADVEEIAGEFSCPVRQVKRAVALLSRSLDEVNETGIQE